MWSFFNFSKCRLCCEEILITFVPENGALTFVRTKENQQLQSLPIYASLASYVLVRLW